MSLYLACGLTMVIETAYFFLIGYRERDFLILCLAVNAVTNLTLNLVIRYTGIRLWIVLFSEVLVVAAEYAVYCLVSKPAKGLLMHTVVANALSFSIGGVLLKNIVG